ncbi:MAG: HU family DNA-binding protein [Deltaproteobacteria bacterium]
MNKIGLISKIARENGVSKVEAEKMIVSITDIITNSLKKGEKVVWTGFGTFLISRRGERNGRNPHTGETIRIPASCVPRFRAGKEFKKIVS